jgi:hypothetical protein
VYYDYYIRNTAEPGSICIQVRVYPGFVSAVHSTGRIGARSEPIAIGYLTGSIAHLAEIIRHKVATKAIAQAALVVVFSGPRSTRPLAEVGWQNFDDYSDLKCCKSFDF